MIYFFVDAFRTMPDRAACADDTGECPSFYANWILTYPLSILTLCLQMNISAQVPHNVLEFSTAKAMESV